MQVQLLSFLLGGNCGNSGGRAVRRSIHKSSRSKLYAALTPSDPLLEALTVLISAWQKLGVIDKRVLAEFVGYTIAIFGSNKFKWRKDGVLGWVNNSQWSARNPKLKALSKADLGRIHRFLSGAGSWRRLRAQVLKSSASPNCRVQNDYTG